MQSVIETGTIEACYICGAQGKLEKHHIFGGDRNRRWSEKYGLTVHLCVTCHRDNKKGVHADAEIAEMLHKIGQAAFERTHTRQEFCGIFGRNYLDCEYGEGREISDQDDGQSGIWLRPEGDWM